MVCIALGCVFQVSDLLLQVRDKFYLELSEEEAIRVLQNLIDDSVNAIFAVLLERAHKMAQVSVLICLCFVPRLPCSNGCDSCFLQMPLHCVL